VVASLATASVVETAAAVGPKPAETGAPTETKLPSPAKQTAEAATQLTKPETLFDPKFVTYRNVIAGALPFCGVANAKPDGVAPTVYGDPGTVPVITPEAGSKT
jgi:hypothetical protein